MRRALVLALALLTVWIAENPKPLLAAPATWSFQRASLGFDAQGAQMTTSNGSSSSFLPGAYLSYSATSGLSLAGTVQRDFARHTTIGRAGARFKVLDTTRGDIALGANLVGYGDRTAWLGVTHPTSWESTVNGAYDVWQQNGRTVLWGIAQASWDQQNDIKSVRVGLRWQAIGGFLL